MAKIKVELGTTLNISNFSNIKVTVAIEENENGVIPRHDQIRQLHAEVQTELMFSIDDLLNTFAAKDVPMEDPFSVQN